MKGDLLMPTDTLAPLDPAPAESPRFDPHGPAADRVLATALEAFPGTSSASAPRLAVPRRRSRLLGAAAGVAAAAITVTAVGLTGSGGQTLRPAAAFAAAAERTAAHDSGVAHIRTVVKGLTGSIYLDARHDVRFSGGDSEVSQHDLAGHGQSLDGASWRFVDGRGWLREAGGKWEPIPDAGGNPPADEARTILADSEQLLELVRRAEGVTQNGDTFHAKLDTAALRGLPHPLFGLSEGSGIGAVHLTMTRATDGTIAALTVGYDSADGAAVTRTITYEALGEPQDIAAP